MVCASVATLWQPFSSTITKFIARFVVVLIFRRSQTIRKKKFSEKSVILRNHAVPGGTRLFEHRRLHPALHCWAFEALNLGFICRIIDLRKTFF